MAVIGRNAGFLKLRIVTTILVVICRNARKWGLDQQTGNLISRPRRSAVMRTIRTVGYFFLRRLLSHDIESLTYVIKRDERSEGVLGINDDMSDDGVFIKIKKLKAVIWLR